MDFAKQDIVVVSQGAALRVTVAADALLFWWGSDTGPQSADGLVAAHMDEIEAVVAFKIGRQAFEADGSILISEDDLE